MITQKEMWQTKEEFLEKERRPLKREIGINENGIKQMKRRIEDIERQITMLKA